jgi:NADH dehydrogenase
MMVPVPALGVSAIAAMFDRFESFPVTRDQIQMLLEGNTCGDGAFAQLGIEPTPFGSDQLRYLSHPQKEPEQWRQNAA